MIRKMLYRVERADGGYTVSSERPPEGVRYKVRWRLIADEGRAITDGEYIVTVIDVFTRSERDRWQDCDLPLNNEPGPEELAEAITEEMIEEGIL